MSEIPPARPVCFETSRFTVRSVVEGDAGENWTRWASDREAARWLNATPREISRVDLVHYIASFDNRSRFLIGMFERAPGERMIGFNSIYVDWTRREYMINTLIGESDARHKGARSETRLPIHAYFLEELGLESSVCTVVEGHPSLALMESWGWKTEHRSEKASAGGGAPIGILHMRLTKTAWRRANGKSA